MRASTYKLTLLPVTVCHLLAIICVATASSIGRCDCGDIDHFWRRHSWRCRSRPIVSYRPIIGHYDRGYCGRNYRVENCMIPQFQCVGNSRCIPRRHLCNGIPDCSDGSDEWGCTPDTTTTTSTVSTTTSRMYSESTESTSSYSIATNTMLRDNEEKTTRDVFPESVANTSSTSTTTSMILPHSESNNAVSSTTSTVIPNSEPITTISSYTTTKTMIPDTEWNTPPTPTTYTRIIEFESNTTTSSFTRPSTMIPDSESKTGPSSSRTSSTILDFESNTVTSYPTTTKTLLKVSEENSPISSFASHNTMVPESAEKTSPPTANAIFPESSGMQSCPDNYCMQNAECVVVQGQYRCQCPSSFIGELCEIKLGTEQGSYQYTVAIVISMTLVILCLATVPVCIYRYKRLSSWKSRDMTSRTLSQMTLASDAVE